MKVISLKEMQKIELNLLQEFDQICKSQGLRYYIDGGTLLGAMCYEGFIPWDDDIDLKMPRPDYERFLQLAPSLLPKHVAIEAPSKEYPNYLMTKLVDTRTVLIEDGDITKQTGVYIDLFPMDGYPNDPTEREQQITRISKLNTRFHMSLNNFKELKTSSRLVSRVKGVLYSIIYTPFRTMQKLNKTAQKYDYDACHDVGLLIEGNYEKEMFPKEWLEPAVELEFEGQLFPAPCGYIEHMVVFYGEHVVDPACYHNLPNYGSNHKHKVYWKEKNEF